jgi:hypothetical protein
MSIDEMLHEALAVIDDPDDLVAAARYLSDVFDIDPDEAYFIVREM